MSALGHLVALTTRWQKRKAVKPTSVSNKSESIAGLSFSSRNRSVCGCVWLCVVVVVVGAIFVRNILKMKSVDISDAA